MTGDDGTFSLAVPPGSYTLQATFIGYQAAKQNVEVAAGEMTTVDFFLNASPVRLGLRICRRRFADGEHCY